MEFSPLQTGEIAISPHLTDRFPYFFCNMIKHPKVRSEFRVRPYISDLISYIPWMAMGLKLGYRGERSEWKETKTPKAELRVRNVFG
jgi:hypothetical protein